METKPFYPCPVRDQGEPVNNCAPDRIIWENEMLKSVWAAGLHDEANCFEDTLREKMKVLIACEESQTVCKAFRAKGHEAYSCDIQKPSGGHPEWHILGDALKAIEGGQVTTMDGQVHDVGRWDLLIAHPPCTYLSNVAGIHFSLKYTAAEKNNSKVAGTCFSSRILYAILDCERRQNRHRKPCWIYEYGIPKR